MTSHGDAAARCWGGPTPLCHNSMIVCSRSFFVLYVAGHSIASEAACAGTETRRPGTMLMGACMQALLCAAAKSHEVEYREACPRVYPWCGSLSRAVIAFHHIGHSLYNSLCKLKQGHVLSYLCNVGRACNYGGYSHICETCALFAYRQVFFSRVH